MIIDIIESIALVWGNPQKKILLAKSSEEYAVSKGVISQNLLAKIIIQSLLHFLILFSLLELCHQRAPPETPWGISRPLRLSIRQVLQSFVPCCPTGGNNKKISNKESH